MTVTTTAPVIDTPDAEALPEFDYVTTFRAGVHLVRFVRRMIAVGTREDGTTRRVHAVTCHACDVVGTLDDVTAQRCTDVAEAHAAQLRAITAAPTTAPAVPAWITAAEFTAARVSHLTLAAAAGDVTAYNVLAARREVEQLADAYRRTAERMTRSDDTPPAFADAIAEAVAGVVGMRRNTDPYAPEYARSAVVYAYRAQGLPGVLDEISRRGEMASHTAVVLDRTFTARATA